MATRLLLSFGSFSFDLFLCCFFRHTSVGFDSCLGFFISTSLDLLIFTFSFLSSFTEKNLPCLLEKYFSCQRSMCFSYGSRPPRTSILHSGQVCTGGRFSRIFRALRLTLHILLLHLSLLTALPPNFTLSR